MDKRPLSPRPELLVDQMNVFLVDPDGNQVGRDGPVLADGSNLSTMSRGKTVFAIPQNETRRF
jgi:hypothetical protein